MCNNAADTFVERFDDILPGVQSSSAEIPMNTGRVGNRIISSPDEADPEIPNAIKRVKLQHDLSARFDQDGHGRFLGHFDALLDGDCDCKRIMDVCQRASRLEGLKVRKCNSLKTRG